MLDYDSVSQGFTQFYLPPQTPHGCCGSRRMFCPPRSARDPYCMRTVSVLCLRISARIRRDPQPNFESDFMFHVCCGCCGLSQSVLAPYARRTASANFDKFKQISVLSPYSLRDISSALYALRSAAAVRRCERDITVKTDCNNFLNKQGHVLKTSISCLSLSWTWLRSVNCVI